MRPLIAYSARLLPKPAASQHHRAEDSSNALDSEASAAMARLWNGISPISLALAYTDWALHLWSSPGSQSRLASRS